MAEPESQFSNVAIQEVQEFWDNRPCNIRHSSKEIGTREYFDDVDERRYFVEPHIPAFADFPRWKDKVVLEVGCGIGTDTVSFAREGARVTALDLSPTSVNIARQRADVYGLNDRIQFVVGDAEELTELTPLDKYDLIYSFGVIHHSPHPERVVAQMRELIGPDGEVRLMVYHRLSWKVLWILLTYGKGRFWRLSELIARHSEAQTGCPITYAYTRGSARAMLERHGFRTTEVSVQHIFPYRIPDYIQYRYVKEWYFRWLPKPVFNWLERRFGWHLCITAVLDTDVDRAEASGTS